MNHRLDPKDPRRLTPEEARQLDKAAIDYSDIRPLDEEFFARAERPRFLTLGNLVEDPWNVMRGMLPPDADVALLLAARAAAFDVEGRIMAVQRRTGFNEPTAWLLDLAHMSVIGRIAMLDNWRGQLLGTAFISRPYGEDTDYARAMRLHPAKLAEVIAIAEQHKPFPGPSDA